MATILVVDDSASMRQMVEFTLKEAGHQVMVAEDGQVGLNTVSYTHLDMYKRQMEESAGVSDEWEEF